MRHRRVLCRALFISLPFCCFVKCVLSISRPNIWDTRATVSICFQVLTHCCRIRDILILNRSAKGIFPTPKQEYTCRPVSSPDGGQPDNNHQESLNGASVVSITYWQRAGELYNSRLFFLLLIFTSIEATTYAFMDYHFQRNFIGRPEAFFSMGYEAMGVWLTEELGNNHKQLDHLLVAIDSLEKRQRWEYFDDGMNFRLHLTHDVAEVRAALLETDMASDEMEEMDYYDSESISHCGLDDFKNLLLQWQQFLSI